MPLRSNIHIFSFFTCKIYSVIISLHECKFLVYINRYELVETILSSGIVSEILIRQADRRDSALFSCIASNAYGRDDTNIQLIVQGKKNIFIIILRIILICSGILYSLEGIYFIKYLPKHNKN